MSGVVMVMAIAVFLAGFAVGVVLTIAYAVRREDRYYGLEDRYGRVPGPPARVIRRLTGAGQADLDAGLFRPDGGDLTR